MPIAIEKLADAVGAAGRGLAAVADVLLPVTVQVRTRGRRGGSGSGIVWRSDGLIVTNAHVARGERAAVGVNAMIVDGLGYAVPTHVVERFLRGSAERGALGIAARPVAVAGGVPGALGLLVVGVERGSAAESAGILLGDVLIAADGGHFRSPDDLPETLAPGRATTVDLVRTGRALRLAVTPRAVSRAA